MSSHHLLQTEIQTFTLVFQNEVMNKTNVFKKRKENVNFYLILLNYKLSSV